MQNQPFATVRGAPAPSVSRPAPAGHRPSVASAGEAKLYALRPGEMWRYLRQQPLSFQLLCFYLFLEYVRPQSLYPVLDVLPWSLGTLMLALGAFFIERNGFRLADPISKGIVFYLVIVAASTATAFSPGFALARWELIFSWALIYFLIANSVVTEGRFLIFALTFLLWSMKMAQHSVLSWASVGFQFRDWGTTGAPGWFHNSGEFGIQMCVFAPMAAFFAFGLWRHLGRTKALLLLSMPVAAVIGTVASSSRGAVLGVAVVGLWFLLKSRHKVRGLIAVGVLAVVVYAVMPEQQKQRFESSGEDKTSVRRLTYWKNGIEITKEHPVLGVGYSNWLPYYRTYYDARGEVSHNIFIQASSELGFIGLGAFCLLIGYTFVVNGRTRKALRDVPGGNTFLTSMSHGLDGALVGFLVSGQFVTVLYYPYFWINLAFTAALSRAAQHEVAQARANAGVTMPRPVVQAPRRALAERPAWHVPASAPEAG